MDDTNGIVDFSAVLTARECGSFEVLRDKTCFDQARLELGVVIWPHGADMDPGWIHEQVRANKSWSPFDVTDRVRFKQMGLESPDRNQR